MDGIGIFDFKAYYPGSEPAGAGCYPVHAPKHGSINAKRLKQTQSYVSKLERGAVRLDFVQVRRVCGALGVSLPDFVRRFEKTLAEQ